MNHNFLKLWVVILLTCSSSAVLSLKAQSLVDGFVQGKGHGSIVVSYSWEQYDSFYFGTEQRDAPPPYGGLITTQAVSLYGIYGLTDNLDVVLNLPYIAARGNNDAEGTDVPDQDVGGLQDVSVMLKWRPIHLETDKGTLSFLGAVGFATPLSDYQANAVLSIGNQSTRGDIRLMTQYKANSGLFIDMQAGYSLRSNDVPNAAVLFTKVGYAGSHFYVDLWSETQISNRDAPDIGGVPFNETRVNYTQIGISGYVPITGGLGLSAGVGQYVWGRNVGLATRVSGGVIYSF
jgi:hypothetical protein